MKNADSMTPEQLRELADEKEKQAGDVKRFIGYAKHDIFYLNPVWRKHVISSDRIRDGATALSRKDIDKIKSDIEDSLDIIVKKGDPVHCVVEDGKQLWYDDEEYFLMNEEWAKKML